MANSSKKKSGLQRGESKAAFLFCTPAVVLALVFIILPFAMSVVYSFTNKQLIPKVGMETAFVGLKNYIEIFTSKVTVLSFKNTFLYKLTWKQYFPKEINGKPTFYGLLINGTLNQYKQEQTLQ